MKNSKIMLLNLQKVTFKNDKTGEISDMTKITYGTSILETEVFKGLSILETYVGGKAFEMLQKVLGKECVATIEERPTTNGVKYVITKINDAPLK